MNKIILIGPVNPYRGGIAHFLTTFSSYMSKISDIQIISFKRLYPKFLYPGKFQKELNIKKSDNTDYVIDTLNPLTWIKAVKKIISSKPDVVIFTYWTSYLFFVYFFLIIVLRKKNIKIAINFHNLIDHEARSVGSFFTKNIIKKSDYVIYEEIGLNINNFIKINQKAKYKYLTKPCNQDFNLNIEAFKKKKKLELLFYGFIRHYKGLDILLEAMSLVKNQIDVHLSIVGEIWHKNEKFWRSLISSFNLQDSVSFNPSYVSTEDTVKYFKRSDFIVMPYRSVTGSGILPMVYYFNKGIIASNIGNLPELIIENDRGFIFQNGDSLDLSKKIVQANNINLKQKIIRNNNFINKYNFENYTKEVQNFLFNNK